VVIAYFSVFLNDKSGSKVNVFGYWRKLGSVLLRLNSDLCLLEGRNKLILQVPVGGTHFLDAL